MPTTLKSAVQKSPLRQPCPWNAIRVQHYPQEVAGVGRRRTDRAARPKGNPRVYRLGLRSRAGQRGHESWPYGEQGPRASSGRDLLGVGARHHRDAPQVSEGRVPAGRGGPTLLHQGRDQRSLLRDPSNETTKRMGPAIPGGQVLASRPCRVLQLRRGFGDSLADGALPRADPLAAYLVEPRIARSRG
jgi:hypothetical protein